MVRYNELSEEQKKELIFTPEERKQLDKARKKPIVYDAELSGCNTREGVTFPAGASGAADKRSIMKC